MPEIWVPTGTGRSDFTEKKSRFIGEARKAETAESARLELRSLRDEHPRSRHVVWAYVLGNEGALKGLSDDGEPHGTAGKPVLDPIEGNRLTFTLVTVVRYFGGVKLGTGGLVSAYSRCCREALEDMPREKLISRCEIRLEIEYQFIEPIRKLVNRFGGIVGNENFGSSVKMELEIPTISIEEFRLAVADASRGNADFMVL